MNSEFITQLLQLGVGGVDLKRSIDMISPTRGARMTNLARDEEGRLALRPGQLRLAWGTGGAVHSMARVQAALAGGEYLRFFGVGGVLQAGTSGALATVDDGFSGLPLTMLPGHPPLSGDSWLYVADSAKMIKVRVSDRLVMPLGLHPPATACAVILGSDNQTVIDTCDLAGWTNNAGTGGTPSNAANSDAKVGAASLGLTTAVGSATAGYYNFWGKANALDLSKLTGVTGIISSADDDQIHLWLKMDKPGSIDEIKIYFVVSNDFSASVLPGTSTTNNTNAYVKSFIPGMFTPIVEVSDDANAATADALAQRLLEEALQADTDRGGTAAQIQQQQSETSAVASRRLSLGRGQWTEFGAVGTPLRRGEFLRIGSDTSRDWSTVTGMVIYVKTTSAVSVLVQLDDIFMRGGYNPDTSEPTSVPYDYIYRHYDPRTGAKSRYAPVSAQIDCIRQNIRLMPEAYGDSNIRQEFFRRGGTLPSDWYFVGRNRSDGGCGKDNVLDAEAQAAGSESDDDFHQPVTTQDVDGNAVYAQPIPIIFGPISGYLLGLGDPYRPGHVYWTLPDEYDHWPRLNRLEVCSPDEELMTGGVFGGNAFCFSRGMMYSLLVGISDGKVRSQPTACARGVVSRWAVAVGLDGIYFVDSDAIWKTTGGVPQSITDDLIQSLFLGTEKNGYAPVDWSSASEIRLAVYRNELWFLFRDTNGDKQVWIYSIVFGFWRHYDFAWPIASVFGEDLQQESPRLLLGAADSGRVYSHEGFHDDGLAITGTFRSGALNQGQPRVKKLYGDLELEMDLQGAQAEVTAYLDKESIELDAVTVNPLVGPQVYLIDAFGSRPVLANDASFQVVVSSMAARPWLGRGGPSQLPQPESSIGRATDWDELGSPTNKLVKGILIEADTFGYLKRLTVEGDGASGTPLASFTVQSNGRQFHHVVFDEVIDCRVIRLAPSDTAPWLPYEVRWIFDYDPLQLTRWETQPTDHGVPVDQTLLWAYVTLKSTAEVSLEITVTRASGATQTETVTIPSTGGERIKQYVKLPALKGLMFKYVFSAADGSSFRLFREESIVMVQAWAADAPQAVQPFGTDGMDVARIVRDSENAGLRGQRWIDTSAAAGKTQ